MRPRLLQVCNVGQICGGTAACAWTVTRALPGFSHVVAFLSPIAPETRAAFQPHQLLRWQMVTPEQIRALRPDMVLLHNTPESRVAGRSPVPTLLYLHSQIRPAAADAVVCCSQWLARKLGRSAAEVLWQGVPSPRRSSGPSADDGEVCRTAVHGTLTVGRICTPQPHKWPASVVPFYRDLSTRYPQIRWDFVGCPERLQTELARACGGRTRFWTAGWHRRELLATWDALVYHQPHLPESFGRTVAEAMRAGCVPIVDRLGGFCEQLDAGGGILCSTFAEFAAAIGRLMGEHERRELSQRARHIGDARWSLVRFARDLLTSFDRTVQASRSCGSTIAKRGAE